MSPASTFASLCFFFSYFFPLFPTLNLPFMFVCLFVFYSLFPLNLDRQIRTFWNSDLKRIVLTVFRVGFYQWSQAIGTISSYPNHKFSSRQRCRKAHAGSAQRNVGSGWGGWGGGGRYFPCPIKLQSCSGSGSYMFFRYWEMQHLNKAFSFSEFYKLLHILTLVWDALEMSSLYIPGEKLSLATSIIPIHGWTVF